MVDLQQMTAPGAAERGEHLEGTTVAGQYAARWQNQITMVAPGSNRGRLQGIAHGTVTSLFVERILVIEMQMACL